MSEAVLHGEPPLAVTMLKDEISRLEVEIAALRSALRPFARQRKSTDREMAVQDYGTPAERLRDQADAIEDKDRQIHFARDAMKLREE